VHILTFLLCGTKLTSCSVAFTNADSVDHTRVIVPLVVRKVITCVVLRAANVLITMFQALNNMR